MWLEAVKYDGSSGLESNRSWGKTPWHWGHLVASSERPIGSGAARPNRGADDSSVALTGEEGSEVGEGQGGTGSLFVARMRSR